MLATKPACRDGVREANGLKLHYVEWGDRGRRPMVLLHGITSHAHSWDTFAKPAAHTFRVIALDQRGHGESHRGETYKTADFVADLKDFADGLRLQPFVLVGLSMGAHNAMAYASQHPSEVAKLVLVDLAPYHIPAPNPLAERTAAAAKAGYKTLEEAVALAREGNPIASDHELWIRAYYGTKRRDDGQFTFKHDPAVREKWEREDLWGKIGKITAPTLILRGAESQTFQREDGLRMEKTIPNAKFVEVPGAGHTINNDQPDLFFSIVSSFLLGEHRR